MRLIYLKPRRDRGFLCLFFKAVLYTVVVPELPEVEITRRGIEPHALGLQILKVNVRERRLRWTIPLGLESKLENSTFASLGRRGKYLLFHLSEGTLLVHLGMSGSLRLVSTGCNYRKHDHVDIALLGGTSLRFHDPRRFGCMLWINSGSHPLLDHLGPEPFQDGFNGEYLYRLSRGRSAPVKNFIMDSKVVVGVGNIYANESLFMAGIRPDRSAGRISFERYRKLADMIRLVLKQAIDRGGTTLRDFVGGDGRAGYFAQHLLVYGRTGQECRSCRMTLREIRQSNRSTVMCVRCQR